MISINDLNKMMNVKCLSVFILIILFELKYPISFQNQLFVTKLSIISL